MKLIATIAITALVALAATADDDDSATAIRQSIERQAAAWNTGNLEEFMDAYLKGEDLVFSSGGNVRRGWQTTFDAYQKHYGTAKETMGYLAFSDLEIYMLGDDGAWVLGRWKLTYDDGKTEGGIFTLVWKKVDDGWRIVHDHTSADSK